MKPQNYKERNIALLKFVLLFTVTCTLVVVAVFFGTRLPVKENEYLRDRLRTVEFQLQAERRFAGRMENIKQLLDSMDLPNVNSDYMQQLISAELAGVQSIIPVSDSSYRQKMYSNVLQTYLELKTAKHSLIKMKGVEKSIEEYSQLVDQYSEELRQTQRDLDICRQLPRR